MKNTMVSVGNAHMRAISKLPIPGISFAASLPPLLIYSWFALKERPNHLREYTRKSNFNRNVMIFILN